MAYHSLPQAFTTSSKVYTFCAIKEHHVPCGNAFAQECTCRNGNAIIQLNVLYAFQLPYSGFRKCLQCLTRLSYLLTLLHLDTCTCTYEGLDNNRDTSSLQGRHTKESFSASTYMYMYTYVCSSSLVLPLLR